MPELRCRNTNIAGDVGQASSLSYQGVLASGPAVWSPESLERSWSLGSLGSLESSEGSESAGCSESQRQAVGGSNRVACTVGLRARPPLLPRSMAQPIAFGPGNDCTSALCGLCALKTSECSGSWQLVRAPGRCPFIRRTEPRGSITGFGTRLRAKNSNCYIYWSSTQNTDKSSLETLLFRYPAHGETDADAGSRQLVSRPTGPSS
jgi:hypothetical protein